MDILRLCKMQQELDNKIIELKNLKWTEEERFFNTVVALDNELSEFANEARWFKVWSKNQLPGPSTLEEYADALHFFLSIANQKGWQEQLYLHEEAILDLEAEGFHGGLNGAFIEMKFNLFHAAAAIDQENYFLGISKNRFHFRSAWFLFIAIGLIGFNFSEEEIEEAYIAKHQKNHERQETGY